jgi:hypothetical protein
VAANNLQIAATISGQLCLAANNMIISGHYALAANDQISCSDLKEFSSFFLSLSVSVSAQKNVEI